MPINKTVVVLLVSLGMANCKKTLQVSYPHTEVPESQVFANDSSTIAVVTGTCIALSGPGSLDGTKSLYLELGLAADELDAGYPDPDLLAMYTDAFSPAQSDFWNFLYTQVYPCNAVINSWPAAKLATAGTLRRQAIGEALFLRAFLLYYATALYGAIPVPTTPDFQTNNTLTRSPQPVVYSQLISDLTTASILLPADYRDSRGQSTSERVRPNRWAAMSLLARLHLYAGNWAAAQTAADSVIAAGSAVTAGAQYRLLTDLNQVFLANSPEAIWQIPPVYNLVNTYAAYIFALNGAPDFEHPVAMSPDLVNAFEPGDGRFDKWVGQTDVPATGPAPASVYYYPYKYKVPFSTPAQEYLMVLRLGEQYLIRAEAKAHQGDLIGAAADLNVLRGRAGLAATSAATPTQLVSAIAHERQVELFTEFGDRWFDLRRTGAIDSVMQRVQAHKGGTWHSYNSLLPVPAAEIQANPRLTQNPGY